jgi:hypothetical protein
VVLCKTENHALLIKDIMNHFFEQYRSLYENRYTLEAWVIWASLWIQYIGYYVCLYTGFILLICLVILPFISIFGIYHSIKIKIKKDKEKKKQKKLKEQIGKDYINTLDSFKKKKKGSKK